MSTHALTELAMVCNLSLGIWQGYRLDKAASADVTDRAGASKDAARVNKHLIPKEALAPVVTASGAVRTHFYTNTLPWRDNGDRILTRKLYLKFIEEHEKLVGEFRDAVETFLVRDYPGAIEQAQFRMGELFDRADYPAVGELRHRFYVTLDIDAVTTSNDFRVQIDTAHVDKIKASMEAAAESRLQAATADVWRRIGEAIGYFHQRMSDPKAVFRDSTVKNVEELLDLIPGLNVLDDPAIEEVRALIAKNLGGADVKALRSDSDYRAAMAGDAQEVLDKMSGFMNAFAPAQRAA